MRLLGIAPLLLLISIAEAHLGHEVQTAERYLKMDFAEGHVRVVVSLMLGPTEAQRVLTVADRENGEGDGELTPAESDAYMARWAEGLVTDLPVEVDGAELAIVWGEPYLEPTGRISARPATVEMVAHVPLAAGQHRVTLRDRMRRDSFDRTDVAFRDRGGSEILASGAGVSPQDQVPALAFSGSQGPDVFTAVANIVTDAGEPLVPPVAVGAAPSWPWLVVPLVAVALVGVAYGKRRRRSRSGTGS